jgi:hypothetical protein
MIGLGDRVHVRRSSGGVLLDAHEGIKPWHEPAPRIISRGQEAGKLRIAHGDDRASCSEQPIPAFAEVASKGKKV